MSSLAEPSSQSELQAAYEAGAKPASMAGWACSQCRQFFHYEGGAKACCTHVRQCSGCNTLFRDTIPYSSCPDCRSKQEKELWEAKPIEEWDGKFPLSLWRDDKYFWDADDLLDYIEEISDEAADSLQLVACEIQPPSLFEMSEFLCDDLAEGQEVDSVEIDKTVNDWIAANKPPVYWSTDRRLDPLAVLLSLGWLPPEKKESA